MSSSRFFQILSRAGWHLFAAHICLPKHLLYYAFWTDTCRSEHVQVAKMRNFGLQQIHFKSENTHHVCNQNVCWQDTLTVSLEPLVRFILPAALLTSGHSAGASACFICIWKTLKHIFQQLTIANQQMFEQNHCLPDHGCGDQGACIMHEYSICVSTKTIFWMSSLFLSFVGTGILTKFTFTFVEIACLWWNSLVICFPKYVFIKVLSNLVSSRLASLCGAYLFAQTSTLLRILDWRLQIGTCASRENEKFWSATDALQVGKYSPCMQSKCLLARHFDSLTWAIGQVHTASCFAYLRA